MCNKVPILYKRKEDCCGCAACYSACPMNAISMREDEEGFLYPQINEIVCIGCGICLKICQMVYMI